MDKHKKRLRLERELQTASGPARRRLLRELSDLSGHRGADIRPAGQESEKR